MRALQVFGRLGRHRLSTRACFSLNLMKFTKPSISSMHSNDSFLRLIYCKTRPSPPFLQAIRDKEWVQNYNINCEIYSLPHILQNGQKEYYIELHCPLPAYFNVGLYYHFQYLPTCFITWHFDHIHNSKFYVAVRRTLVTLCCRYMQVYTSKQRNCCCNNSQQLERNDDPHAPAPTVVAQPNFVRKYRNVMQSGGRSGHQSSDFAINRSLSSTFKQTDSFMAPFFRQLSI